MHDVGIDPGVGPKNTTGLAVLDEHGRLRYLTRVHSDEEILGLLRPWTGSDCLVAIDAPIIVVNADGAGSSGAFIAVFLAHLFGHG